jgi:hypothetical protein
LAKVYLRNFGKGILEISDHSLKLYVEKGRFSKKKELGKEILFVDVDGVVLEMRELVVHWKEFTDRFVFDDAASAQQAYSMISQFSQKHEESEVQGLPENEIEIGSLEHESGVAASEVPEPSKIIESEAVRVDEVKVDEGKQADQVVAEEVGQKVESVPLEVTAEPEVESNVVKVESEVIPQEADKIPEVVVEEIREVPVSSIPPLEIAAKNAQRQTLSESMSIVDSLFDILLSLHGRVDWARTGKCLTLAQDHVAHLAKASLVKFPFDFSELSSAVSLHTLDSISAEVYRQLTLFYPTFQSLELSDTPIITNSKPSLVMDAMQSYYVLNDILIGVAVGDEKIAEEIAQLSNMLAKLANDSGITLKVDEMISPLKRLSSEKIAESLKTDIRSSFACQLKLLMTG